MPYYVRPLLQKHHPAEIGRRSLDVLGYPAGWVHTLKEHMLLRHSLEERSDDARLDEGQEA